MKFALILGTVLMAMILAVQSAHSNSPEETFARASRLICASLSIEDGANELGASELNSLSSLQCASLLNFAIEDSHLANAQALLRKRMLSKLPSKTGLLNMLKAASKSTWEIFKEILEQVSEAQWKQFKSEDMHCIFLMAHNLKHLADVVSTILKHDIRLEMFLWGLFQCTSMHEKWEFFIQSIESISPIRFEQQFRAFEGTIHFLRSINPQKEPKLYAVLFEKFSQNHWNQLCSHPEAFFSVLLDLQQFNEAELFISIALKSPELSAQHLKECSHEKTMAFLEFAMTFRSSEKARRVFTLIPRQHWQLFDPIQCARLLLNSVLNFNLETFRLVLSKVTGEQWNRMANDSLFEIITECLAPSHQLFFNEILDKITAEQWALLSSDSVAELVKTCIINERFELAIVTLSKGIAGSQTMKFAPKQVVELLKACIFHDHSGLFRLIIDSCNWLSVQSKARVHLLSFCSIHLRTDMFQILMQKISVAQWSAIGWSALLKLIKTLHTEHSLEVISRVTKWQWLQIRKQRINDLLIEAIEQNYTSLFDRLATRIPREHGLCANSNTTFFLYITALSKNNFKACTYILEDPVASGHIPQEILQVLQGGPPKSLRGTIDALNERIWTKATCLISYEKYCFHFNDLFDELLQHESDYQDHVWGISEETTFAQRFLTFPRSEYRQVDRKFQKVIEEFQCLAMDEISFLVRGEIYFGRRSSLETLFRVLPMGAARKWFIEAVIHEYSVKYPEVSYHPEFIKQFVFYYFRESFTNSNFRVAESNYNYEPLATIETGRPMYSFAYAEVDAILNQSRMQAAGKSASLVVYDQFLKRGGSIDAHFLVELLIEFTASLGENNKRIAQNLVSDQVLQMTASRLESMLREAKNDANEHLQLRKRLAYALFNCVLSQKHMAFDAINKSAVFDDAFLRLLTDTALKYIYIRRNNQEY